MIQTIEPRSGVGFALQQGQRLKIIDPQGEQVSDLLCYNAQDVREVLSSGRTIDYASRIRLTQGDPFYSNRSRVMFTMVEDTVGTHDFLLTPCSKDTFRIIYGDTNPHPGCEGNLIRALAPFGIEADSIPTTLNLFMNVGMSDQGVIKVLPPLSKPGDWVVIEAKMDLIVGLTACSAGQSNNFKFKPIQYELL